VLLTLWRLLASEACNDGLDCGASIGAFFGALLLGCPLCLYVIYVSSPEHRYYVPKSDTYPEGKGVVRDLSTKSDAYPEGKALVHESGVHLPWNPHQQGAFMCLGTVIFLFSSVIIPATDTTNGSLAVIAIWGALLAAAVLLVIWLSVYDPSDGIPTAELNPDEEFIRQTSSCCTSATLARGDASFEMYCFICDKIYIGKHRYHCRRCNKCTTRFDHHCTFLNQCICGGNYSAFFAAVTIIMCWLYYNATVAVYYAVVAGVDDSCHITVHARATWGRGWFITMSSVLAFMSLIGALALTALFHKHTKLILANKKAAKDEPGRFIATFGGFESLYEFDDQETRRLLDAASNVLFWMLEDNKQAIVSWKANTPWKDGRSLFLRTSDTGPVEAKITRKKLVQVPGCLEWLLGDNTDGQSTIKSMNMHDKVNTAEMRRVSRFLSDNTDEPTGITNDSTIIQTRNSPLPTMQQSVSSKEDEVLSNSNEGGAPEGSSLDRGSTLSL